MALNNRFGSAWVETPFKSCVYASFAISLLLGAGILIIQNNLPPSLPLFYGKPVGEAELTSVTGFLIAPAASFLITLVNTLLSFTFKDVFIKKILILSSFLVTLLITITLIKIITLVGFF